MTQSSYLMSFIKELMKNDSKEMREQKKQELEQDYGKTGSELHSRLSDKQENVARILTVYSAVSERIKESRGSVANIKEDLTECKTLLQCNRAELRRLWVEQVESSRSMELLSNLSNVREAPERIQSFMEARSWRKATDLTLEAGQLIRTQLDTVQALLPIKTELTVKQKNLQDQLKQELHRQVFMRPASTALRRFHREEWLRHSQRSSGRAGGRHASLGSGHKQAGVGASGKAISWSTPAAGVLSNDVNTGRAHYSSLELFNWRSVDMAPVELSPPPCAGDPCTSPPPSDADWSQALLTSVHCLFRMGKVSQVIGDWRQVGVGGMQTELHKCAVLKAVQEISSSASAMGETAHLYTVPQPRYLVELLEVVFDMLFMAASASLLLIRALKHLKKKYGDFPNEESLVGFDTNFVRSCVQNELKSLLTVHLDVSSAGSSGPGGMRPSALGSIDPNQLDLSAYLGRRRLGAFLFSSGTRGNRLMMTGDGEGLGSGSTEDHHQHGHHSSAIGPLFSFGASSHALSVNSYMREHKMKSAADQSNDLMNGPLSTSPTKLGTGKESANASSAAALRGLLVCQPCHGNITAVYTALMEFVDALEEDMAADETNDGRPQQKKPCDLRQFIVQFIERNYLPEVLSSLKHKVDNSLRGVEGLHSVVSQKTERELALNKPILTAVVAADECLSEVKRIALALPDYSERCLEIGLEVMNSFLGLLWKAYKDIGQLTSPDDQLLSSEWARDEDITRFWKKFPSWQQMVSCDERETASGADGAGSSARGLTQGGTPQSKFRGQAGAPSENNVGEVTSERKSQSLANEESKKLFHMISDRCRDKQAGVVTNFQQLTLLARLHESVSWLVQRVTVFNNWLNLHTRSPCPGSGQLDGQYAKMSAELQHLADACLLAVRLECRLQAYNQFQASLPQQVNLWCPLDEGDVDPHVSRFLAVLGDVGEHLVPALSRHKIRFVFEGLGHFISIILIKTMPKITWINSNGLKKMCRNIYRLQQTLSVLTQGHETELVRVKQLYELLHITPESVLNRIMEQGAVYEESVYREVLLLYQRSHPTHDHARMQDCLSRLREVIHMEHV